MGNQNLPRSAGLALAGGILIGGLMTTASMLAAARPGPTPEERALAFLAKEVPRWRKENGCFSCHNNGDGARALYTALRLSRDVSREALDETTRWLADPGKWNENKGDVAVRNRGLARIQFAAALTAAVDAGLIPKGEVAGDGAPRATAGSPNLVASTAGRASSGTGHEAIRGPLVEAAEMLVGDQRPDGSWQIDAVGAVGSPVTYGPVLATYLARRTLEAADPKAFRAAINKADNWLAEQKPMNVLDAAAILLALDGETGPQVAAERQRLLKLLVAGQSPEGGWGPYVNAPPEVFDTAVALLALVNNRGADRSSEDPAEPAARIDVDVEARVARGRRYLIACQLDDGSWPETTRPAGAESYAQRLSTTAWATMALLATERVGK